MLTFQYYHFVVRVTCQHSVRQELLRFTEMQELEKPKLLGGLYDMLFVGNRFVYFGNSLKKSTLFLLSFSAETLVLKKLWRIKRNWKQSMKMKRKLLKRSEIMNLRRLLMIRRYLLNIFVHISSEWTLCLQFLYPMFWIIAQGSFMICTSLM